MPRSEAQRRADKKYNQSIKGKARSERYRESEKGKLAGLLATLRYKKKIRQLADEKLGGKCAWCGKEYGLQKHHINGDGFEDRERNSSYSINRKILNDKAKFEYELLCYDCHKIARWLDKEKRERAFERKLSHP